MENKQKTTKNAELWSTVLVDTSTKQLLHPQVQGTLKKEEKKDFKIQRIMEFAVRCQKLHLAFCIVS